MNTLQLTARALQPDTFARYGTVLAAAGPGRAINAGSTLRFDSSGPLSLHAAGGTLCLALFRARAQAPQGPWQTLERHRLGTQSFIPLGGTRCVVLVALGDAAPEPGTLAAFVAQGDQAFTLHAGTWHHGLIALDDGDFAVIERQAAAVDCDIATLTAPVRLHVEASLLSPP